MSELVTNKESHHNVTVYKGQSAFPVWDIVCFKIGTKKQQNKLVGKCMFTHTHIRIDEAQ